MKLVQFAALIVTLSTMVDGFAQNPNKDKISYQTRIFTPAGTPFNSGATPTPIVLRIYDQPNPPPGTPPLHTTQLTEYVDDGYAPLTMEDPANPSNPLNEIFKNHSNLYVEMEVAGQKLSPLTPLQSVPFAFHANYAVSAGNADNVNQKAITPATITINGIQVFDPSAGLNATSIKIGGSTLIDSSKNLSVASLDLGGNDVIEPDGDIVIRKSTGNPQLQFDNQTGIGGIDASLVLTSDDDLRLGSANLTVNQAIVSEQAMYTPFAEIRGSSPALHFAYTGTAGYDARFELASPTTVTLKDAVMRVEDSGMWAQLHPAALDLGGNPTSNILFHYQNAANPTVTLSAGDKWLHIVRDNGNGPLTQFHSNGALGLNRFPAANILEVEGEASKASAGDWLGNSDRRIKQDIRTITNATDTLSRVRLVDFEFTPEYLANHPGVTKRRYMNVIAQEFQEVFPDYVKNSGEKLASGDAILQVDPYPLTIYSAAAVQELAAENRALRSEIDTLKADLAALRDIVGAISRR